MLNLKQMRVKAGFRKLSDVAKIIGVGANTLSRWENGKRDPSLEQIKNLAKIYHCTPNELLNVEEKESNDARHEKSRP